MLPVCVNWWWGLEVLASVTRFIHMLSIIPSCVMYCPMAELFSYRECSCVALNLIINSISYALYPHQRAARGWAKRYICALDTRVRGCGALGKYELARESALL